MKTTWEVQVMFYRDTNQNEVFATKRFENMNEEEIKANCEKNMRILLERHRDVIKVECEANDLIHRSNGHPKILMFSKKR